MVWPFTRKAAEPDEKSLGNPSPELLALFTGTGIGTISEAEALSVPAVSSAIRLISEAAATLTLCVKKKDDEGNEVEAPEHAAHKLLNGQVNTWLSSYEFIRDLVATALISDAGGMAVVTKVRKQPREIILYRRGTISVDYDTLTDEPTYRNAGTIVAQDTVIHLRAPFGRSPLSLARDAISTAKDMERHAAGLFRNGARPGGLLKSKSPMSEPAAEKVKAQWKAFTEGAANAGKTTLLVGDLDFVEMVMKSTDAEFIANRKFQILEIARAFRVPPAMLFELDRATWSNGEQQGKEFLTYTLAPWLRAIEAALNRALFTPQERADGYRFAFDEDDLTQADLTARATAYSSLISARMYSPNELRKWDGAAPYDGGDEYMNPHTGANQPITPPNGGKPPPESRDDNRQT